MTQMAADEEDLLSFGARDQGQAPCFEERGKLVLHFLE